MICGGRRSKAGDNCGYNMSAFATLDNLITSRRPNKMLKFGTSTNFVTTSTVESNFENLDTFVTSA